MNLKNTITKYKAVCSVVYDLTPDFQQDSTTKLTVCFFDMLHWDVKAKGIYRCWYWVSYKRSFVKIFLNCECGRNVLVKKAKGRCWYWMSYKRSFVKIFLIASVVEIS